MDKTQLRLKLWEELSDGNPIDWQRVAEYRGDYPHDRLSVMQNATRALTLACSLGNYKGKPDVKESIHCALADYDALAIDWLNNLVCPWEDSPAGLKAQSIITAIP